jgi:hypothetical protein
MPNPVDTQTEDEDFVSSREKAKNGYGQNGYQGASSDLPGQSTRMDRDYGLAADPSLDGVTKNFGEAGNWQTRKVSKEAYTPAFGMKAPSEPAKVPDSNVRRSRVQAKPGSFQR